MVSGIRCRRAVKKERGDGREHKGGTGKAAGATVDDPIFIPGRLGSVRSGVSGV